ncbi:tryptophan halogenase family protein [Stappia sp. ES.058]|uniref:tryptophan halogenase family protein n=1 Tax=Stappia sp. ES.058 TaxID=1881061 RepID=UPI00087D4B34|nr:tryptophan halogenase family protein [Stappia sp. ES.058]SDU31169.1 tryptophan halogenase [Stappia sp. ES.058]
MSDLRQTDIAVIGGGATGWMAAAYLKRFLPSAGITVMESPTVAPLGVGESLNDISRRFNSALGLDEHDFLRATDGTYKIGIRFENFDRPGGDFYHPFGRPGTHHRARPDAQEAYAATGLCRQNRFDPGQEARGYHVCATRYSAVLRDFARALGVHHIKRHARDVERIGDDVASVEGVSADLFIDCTGFRALLIGEALDTPFEPLSDVLFNDAAVALRVPYDAVSERPFPYTRCTAMDAGWIWRIPLWSRLGAGYCYSSAHISPAQAEADLRAELKLPPGTPDFAGTSDTAWGDHDLKPMHIAFRHGRHARARRGNCVALGGAFGFIEPLESTGLSMTQAAIMALVPGLADLGGWDRLCRDRFDTTVDFIFAHYWLSKRMDTAYWRDLKQCTPSRRLSRVIEAAGRGDYRAIETDPGFFYRPSNWDVVLSGMGAFDDRPRIVATDPEDRHCPDFVSHLATHIHGPTKWSQLQ